MISGHYYELVEKSISRRGYIVKFSNIENKPRDFEAYISAFGMSHDIVDYVKINNTITGFSGNFCMHRLWIDIEVPKKERESMSFSEYIDSARKSSIEIINKLHSDYSLGVDDVDIYFSGGKGFHLGISNVYVGGDYGESPDLPQRVKRFVQELCKGINNIDMSLYKANGLFRMPHSKHSATNLYKIPLSFEELRDLSADNIKELAADPRFDYKGKASIHRVKCPALAVFWEYFKTADFSYKETYSDRHLNKNSAGDIYSIQNERAKVETLLEEIEKRKVDITKDYQDWVFIGIILVDYFGDSGREYYHRISKFYDHGKGYSEEDCDRRYNYFLKRNTNKGQSNSGLTLGTLFYIASKYNIVTKHTSTPIETESQLFGEALYYCQNAQGLTKGDIVRHCHMVNKAMGWNIESTKVFKIVQDAQKASEKIIEDTISAKPVPEFTEKFLDAIDPDRDRLYTGIKPIDEITKGDLLGKVLVLIGTQGTKKSLLCQQIICLSAIKDNIYSYYSSMEMSDVTWMKRFANRFINTPGDAQTVSYFESIYKQHKDMLYEKVYTDINKAVEDKLILSPKTGMTVDMYRRELDYQLTKGRPIKWLVVDGLSVMGGSYNNIVRQSEEVSRQLQDIAKEFNICVLPIGHVPKEVDPEKRRLYRDVRGGSKWTDNFDYFLSLSRIWDGNPETQEPVFRNDEIYATFYDKRESGADIEMIFDFNINNLEISHNPNKSTGNVIYWRDRARTRINLDDF